jgi:phosphoribosylformimino-5-aminoimidazole carboxamide ribotide isomerase
MPPSFAVVPVLDLRGGEVVHAQRGDRAAYRPIRTPLAEGGGSAPEAVLGGLLTLAPFRQIYIADLDAIEGRGGGGHADCVASLARRFPGVEIWLDGGYRDAEQAVAAASCAPRVVPVLGSETMAHAEVARDLLATLGPAGFVLSLDQRGGRFLGPPELDSSSALWPRRVVAMTLHRVGAGLGPDVDRVAELRRRAAAPDVEIYAAGGVRDAADLHRLAEIGAAGALVATALHDGRLSAADLAPFVAAQER